MFSAGCSHVGNVGWLFQVVHNRTDQPFNRRSMLLDGLYIVPTQTLQFAMTGEAESQRQWRPAPAFLVI